MIITRATPGDLRRLLSYRQEASTWLSERGIDQWNNPFPPEYIAGNLEAGSVFLAVDGDSIAATLTLDTEPEPDLWGVEELQEPCLHLHKLIVRRPYAGRDLGSRLIDWACDRTAQAGGAWVRINVNNHNIRLQRYYLDRGFSHVRTVLGGGVGGAGVAGWLSQRKATRCADHGFAEALHP